MTEHAGRQSRTASTQGTSAEVQQSAGKTTLVEREFAAVQRRAAAAPGDAGVHEAAARGTATSSTSLPHADVIQRAFGRHDISGVQAHTGGEAAASARDMGADAYASGNHVVLGERGSDLHTVAHEAAHIVQQRGGVQLKGGVGAEGDRYERHADAVADQVVQGKSAEALLDHHAGAGSASCTSTGGVTQRKVTVGGRKEDRYAGGTDLTDVEAAWAAIKADPRLKDIQEAAKALLTTWITREAKSKNPEEVSENRHYQDNEELIRALVGDVKSADNLQHEGKLATQAMSDEQVNAGLGTFVARLQQFHAKHEAALGEAARNKGGRYRDWAYGDKGTTIAVGLGTIPADLRSRSGFIADYALAMRKEVAKASGVDWSATMSQGLTPELDAARATHHNTDEASPWVVEARANNAALSAGPSATTAQVLTLAVAIGATLEEKTALAWGLFAIWNTMPMHQSGTHRFHEVMAVAAGFGVPYDRFQ
jgi:hypothetical protein